MNYLTVKSKLVAIQEGQYTTYVFEDLNRELSDDLKYICCIKLPNWQYNQILAAGDVGYLQCHYVDAGKTEWYNHVSGDFNIYKYTNCYFINFIKIKDEINNKEFNF